MKEKRKITESVSKRYHKAGKKHKGLILDEFTEVTGYNRAYASYLLNNWGKKMRITVKGKKITYVLGKVKKKKQSRARKKYYGEEVLKPLKELWYVSGMLCGKYLKAYIDDNLELLERQGGISLQEEQRIKLEQISAATIDRLLQEERKNMELKARKKVKPGSKKLKDKIPVRTYWQWKEDKPGFLEIDLVSHNGGNPSGEFIYTLDATDVKTGWTELRAVKNKAQVYVLNQLIDIEEKLPFKLLGLDSDNGGEFINDHLYRYCEENKITFTRSRTYRKNDGCHVEQKNYSIVRREIGYQRYEGAETLLLLNEIYARLRLITNYFTPMVKQIKKTRIGSKVKKVYDRPQPPYMRVLQSKDVSKEIKDKLKKERAKLNPVKLRKEMVDLQGKLFKMGRKVSGYKVNYGGIISQNERSFVYIR
jgi:hypothetical protein